MPGSDDTNELLNQVAKGDLKARETLLARHRERLNRMVSVWMDDRLLARVDPSDVIQDALTVAYQSLPEYVRDRPVSFYAWLRQLAWNRLIDLHRTHILTQKRSVNREERLGLPDSSAMQLADRFFAPTVSPLQQLVREELQDRMRSTMMKLRPGDHEILALRYLEQLTGPESAEVLGISEDAAKQRHVRAVRRLRALLVDEMPGEVDR